MTATIWLRLRAALLSSCLLLPATVTSAETIPFHAKLQETSHPTAIDTNSDANPAIFVLAEGKSNLGRTTRHGWVEVLPWDGATFCGPTHVLIDYRYGESVFRFLDGSQLFAHFKSGGLCFDFSAGSFAADGEIEIVGGTGRFEGASGILTFHAVSAHSFPNGLGVLDESFEGSIRLP
jgi:hypothetical protein